MQKWLIVLVFIAAAARILWDVRRWSKRGNGGSSGIAVILIAVLGLALLFLALRCL